MGVPYYEGMSLYGQVGESAPEVSGTIEIEPGWQQIAIPSVFGYWDTTLNVLVNSGGVRARIKNYVIDQLEDKYGAGCIEVCNAFPGDEQRFLSWRPSTPDDNEHNFYLMYLDGTNYEHTGFWIKSLFGTPMILDFTEWR